MSTESTIRTLGKVLSDSYGIEVVMSGTGASTNGQTIFLPELKEGLTAAELKTVGTLLDHEAGHIRFSTFTHSNLHPMTKLFSNALEDYRVDYLMSKDYAGMPARFKEYYAQTAGKTKISTLLPQIKIALWTHDYLNEDTAKRPAMIDFLPSEPRKQIEALLDTYKKKIAKDGGTTALTINTAKKILAILKEDVSKEALENEFNAGMEGAMGGQSPDPSIQQAVNRAMTQQERDTRQAESWVQRSAQYGQIQKAAAEKELERISSEEHLKENIKTQLQTEAQLYKDLQNPTTRESVLHKQDVAAFLPASSAAVLEGMAKRIAPPNTVDMPVMDGSLKSVEDVAGDKQLKNKQLKNKEELFRSNYREEREALEKQINEALPSVGRMTQILEKVLQAKSYARTIETDRGKINNSRLARLITDPSFRTPFTTKTKVDSSKGVTVELMVDLSGSMAGGCNSKLCKATAAAYVLGVTLNKMGIKHGIRGFTTRSDEAKDRTGVTSKFASRHYSRYSSILMPIAKSYSSESLKDIDQLLLTQNHFTPLGETLLLTAKEVRNRKEALKIVIVLTDGQPEVEGMDYHITKRELLDAIDYCKQEGIFTFGIGIEDHNVGGFFPNFAIMKNLKELPNKIVTVIKDAIESFNNKEGHHA